MKRFTAPQTAALDPDTVSYQSSSNNFRCFRGRKQPENRVFSSIDKMRFFVNAIVISSLVVQVFCLRTSEIAASKTQRPTYSSDISREEDNIEEECFEPLQIPCEINGYIIPAIVDTGAQITVMSESCAQRCRVANMIDGRYCGQAVGMGSSDILGRISELPMRVGPISYRNRVSILRESRVDLILGLDFLRRFKSEINLDDGILKMKVRGKVIRISFISSDTGHLNASRDGHEHISDDVEIEAEESSSDDDFMSERNEEDYMIHKKMPLRGGYSDRSEMRSRLQERENSRIPTSKSNDFDDISFNDESEDEVKQYLGVSMEGV